MARRLAAGYCGFVVTGVVALVAATLAAEGYAPARTLPPMDLSPLDAPQPPSLVATTAEVVQVPLDHGTRAATLRLPQGSTQGPALVLLHGAGSGSHRDLAEEAEALTRRGIATLVMDKRMPGGGVLRRDFDAMAADAAAAARWLAHHPRVDRERVGVFGCSEGGWVATLAAARFPEDIHLLVLASAPVVTPAEQGSHLAGRALRRAPGWLRRVTATAMAGGPQLTDYAGHDSRTAIGRVQQPVLALWGASDPQVPVAEASRRLGAMPGPLSTRVLPGVGHHLPVDSGWPEHLAAWVEDPITPTRQGVQPDHLVAPATLPASRWFTHPLLHLAAASAVAIACAIRPPARPRIRRNHD